MKQLTAMIRKEQFARLNTEEIWKKVTISKRRTLYISNNGRLKSVAHHTGKIRIWKGANMNGYRAIVSDNKYQLVHRLVALYFIGMCPVGKEVNHINGIKNDNRIENLEYITHSENMLHASRVLGRKMGTHKVSA